MHAYPASLPTVLSTPTPPPACAGSSIGVARCLCCSLLRNLRYCDIHLLPPVAHGHLHQSPISSLQNLLVRVVVTSVLCLHLTDATALRNALLSPLANQAMVVANRVALESEGTRIYKKRCKDGTEQWCKEVCS